MNLFVTIALVGWIPVVLLLFAVLPPRRAVIAAFIAAWMFLPVAEIRVQGIPNYGKVTATSIAVLLGILLFDSQVFTRLRIKWWDLPILVWCCSPFLTSVMNQLGTYDGISAVSGRVLLWGIPYLVGRLYLTTPDAIRDLAIGLLIGGIVYIPLCLFEVRMSPKLHYMLYGFQQHSFAQQVRYGGYRPMVFMNHGLTVALWMISTTLVAIWLWWSKALRQFCGVPLVAIIVGLLFTSVLCKSLGPIVLFAFGCGILGSLALLRTRAVLFCAMLIPVTYITARVTGAWNGEGLLQVVESFVDPARARSMQARIGYENLLIERGLESPLLGWGRWTRYRVKDGWGKDLTVTDGFWIITFGQAGLVGLAALVALMQLPVGLFASRITPAMASDPTIAPAAVIAVLLMIQIIDCLPNAMVSPISMLYAGGLTSFCSWLDRRKAGAAVKRRRLRAGSVQRSLRAI